MKNNPEVNRSKKRYRRGFILIPIAFLLCGYLLLFAVLTPILDPLISVYNLAFSNANVQTITEFGTGSIFDGSNGPSSGTLNWDDFSFPKYGESFGHITVDGTEVDTQVIFGDSHALLNRGACVSLFGHIPGCGKGVLIGAHYMPYFKTLPDVKEGALVHIETTYGSYVYRVYRTDVSRHDNASAYSTELNGNKEILILYTCDLNGVIASTPNRFFAFCEFVSGPSVNLYE